MVKIALTILSIICIQTSSFGQDSYTSRKGTKFFPGHYDIAVTIDSTTLTYELYNHWYSGVYSELRHVAVPLDSLETFNKSNDSVSIHILKDVVKLTDKKYKLNRKIRHRQLCASTAGMRKISFAVDLALEHSLRPRALFSYEDLKLTEEEFKEKVVANLQNK